MGFSMSAFRYITCLTFFSFFSLNAEETPKSKPSTDMESRIEVLEHKVLHQIEKEHRTGAFITGELLVWKTQVNNLPYSYSQEQINSSFGSYINHQTLHRVDFGFEPGFRIELGYLFPFDEWDLTVGWERFSQVSSNRKSANSSSSLYVIWDGIGATTSEKGYGKQSQLYQQIDIALGRMFYFFQHFTMRYYIGLAGLVLEEHLHANYKNASVGNDLVNLQSFVSNDFFSLGLTTGVEAHFHITSGVGIYTFADLMLLAGKTQAKFHEKGISSDLKDTFTIRRSQITTGLKTQFGVGAGLEWNHSFRYKKINFSLQAGYELNYWPNQLELKEVLNSTAASNILSDKGDISFQGFTVKALVLF